MFNLLIDAECHIFSVSIPAHHWFKKFVAHEAQIHYLIHSVLPSTGISGD